MLPAATGHAVNPTATQHAHPTDLDVATHRLVSDLHQPKSTVFWSDLLLSAATGWAAFVVAVMSEPFSWPMFAAALTASLALYRGLCFTHEITHLRRRALPGFETAWNLLFGVPLLLPSVTYVGVHQSHHSLSTYGTSDDPEYLPFANSRRLMIVFGIQSSLLLPVLIFVRFLIVAPVALVWPRFHRWLEVHASSFAMNPVYRRNVTPAVARKMKAWEVGVLATWSVAIGLMWTGVWPYRVLVLWFGVMILICFLNTLRVLGAHEYETDGTARDRDGQLGDSIDTPGGPWTELWAPVGLRYHALHHYFPGIPYHNLATAYRRIVGTLPEATASAYRESTSPSLRFSLTTLYRKAKERGAKLIGR